MACWILNTPVPAVTPQGTLGPRPCKTPDRSLSSPLSHPTPTHNLSPAMDASDLAGGQGNWIYKELLAPETGQHCPRLSAEQRKKEQFGFDPRAKQSFTRPLNLHGDHV